MDEEDSRAPESFGVVVELVIPRQRSEGDEISSREDRLQNTTPRMCLYISWFNNRREPSVHLDHPTNDGERSGDPPSPIPYGEPVDKQAIRNNAE